MLVSDGSEFLCKSLFWGTFPFNISRFIKKSAKILLSSESGIEIKHYHDKFHVLHGFCHNCMELNQGKHGDESENHAVHDHAVLVIFVMVLV